MSRTYRRKNGLQDDYWGVGYELEFRVGGGFYRRYLEGAELKRSLAIYHSDTAEWAWHVPSDFRRCYNRRRRAQNKSILACAIRDMNDEPNFASVKKDVGYDYW